MIFKMIELYPVKFYRSFHPEFMSGDWKNRLKRNFRLELRQMSRNAHCCFPCQFEYGTRFRSRNRTGFHNPEPPVRENQPRRMRKPLRDKAFRAVEMFEIKQIIPLDFCRFVGIEQNRNGAFQVKNGRARILSGGFFGKLRKRERFRCRILQGFRKIPVRKRR